ncbi:dentin sialophosphoprotein-like [Pyrus ussuriensis x Pyrus communis]|uniref:Dentin sialophosphoprotein-like n=1 Tax=Pyrus ussuriensis x Pyrus communis TaxID=2448454 RepID=A0A5N5FIK5_9ROSA|nr:dentin sialophosphoprotein-like [Pyrus ussuriensis x Pyrus communis]
MSTYWFQDDLLGTTSSKASDNKTTDKDDDSFDAWNDFASSSSAPNLVDGSVKQSGVDWVHDNQLQTTVNKPADNKTTDADDDSFDAWNDFTGSNNASNLANSSVQQSNNQTTPMAAPQAVTPFPEPFFDSRTFRREFPGKFHRIE